MTKENKTFKDIIQSDPQTPQHVKDYILKTSEVVKRDKRLEEQKKKK